MTKKKGAIPPEILAGESGECTVGGVYKMEALLGVDERGQMVLPKDLREKIGIRPGDKLAVFTFEKEGKFCCLALVKAENLSIIISTILKPLGQDVMEK